MVEFCPSILHKLLDFYVDYNPNKAFQEKVKLTSVLGRSYRRVCQNLKCNDDCNPKGITGVWPCKECIYRGYLWEIDIVCNPSICLVSPSIKKSWVDAIIELLHNSSSILPIINFLQSGSLKNLELLRNIVPSVGSELLEKLSDLSNLKNDINVLLIKSKLEELKNH